MQASFAGKRSTDFILYFSSFDQVQREEGESLISTFEFLACDVLVVLGKNGSLSRSFNIAGIGVHVET